MRTYTLQDFKILLGGVDIAKDSLITSEGKFRLFFDSQLSESMEEIIDELKKGKLVIVKGIIGSGKSVISAYALKEFVTQNKSIILVADDRTIDDNDLIKLNNDLNYVIYYDYHSLGAPRSYLDLNRVKRALRNAITLNGLGIPGLIVLPSFYPWHKYVWIDGKSIFDKVYQDVLKALNKNPCNEVNEVPEEYKTPLFARMLAESSPDGCKKLLEEPGRTFVKFVYRTLLRSYKKTLIPLLFEYVELKVNEDLLNAVNMRMFFEKARKSKFIEESLRDPFLRSAYRIILLKYSRRIPLAFYNVCNDDLMCMALKILSEEYLGKIYENSIELPENVNIPCDFRFSEVAEIRLRAIEQCVKEGKKVELSLLLDLLSVSNVNIRERAWDLLPNSKIAREVTIDLLAHEDYSVRFTAWSRNYNVLPSEVLKERIRYFIRLLVSHYSIALEAWDVLPKLAKLIPKDYLIELLKFDDEYYRALAWWKIAGRVLSIDEVKEYLPYYIVLLKSERENHRLWMWKLVPKFIKISDKKEITDNLNYFLELLKSEHEDIRIEAWRLVPKFMGILLNEEDIKQNSRYLLELLHSEEKSIRAKAWRLAIKLLKDFDKGMNS
ncbi:hypothetical protein [Saccharolobus islandicus]|uniref:hypothetical protein n=1 Tax=Saccharolobus islandicus TaxID=43080 RepID=UPI00037716F6|nr:hypothetical protein [Sulfolobus islandicus]